ncbi:MAG TPA: hypothetical protein DCR97_03120 [Deltaproteobacteria bacterium]|nr:hypothetical protein [Deltaproteobacteria bacterium]
MFVRSTGLGRTLLSGRIAKIETTNLVPATLEMPKNGEHEPTRVLMEMEITNPVHWTVRAFLDPPDLRHMVKIILTNPVFIMNGLKFLFKKGPDYGAPKEEVHAGTPKAAAAAPSVPKGPAPIPKAGPGPVPAR